MGARLNLSGRVFGRLTVIGDEPERVNNVYHWRCRCECGTEKTVACQSLSLGRVHSCGCLQRDTMRRLKTTHGGHQDRLYKTWCNMHSRCSKGHPDAQYYHDRGIAICKEWSDYAPFREWALASGYESNLTIERQNNDDGYHPGNCIWADRKVQSRNKSNNVYVEFNGQQILLVEAAEKSPVSLSCIRRRIGLGWAAQKAITTPLCGYPR